MYTFYFHSAIFLSAIKLLALIALCDIMADTQNTIKGYEHQLIACVTPLARNFTAVYAIYRKSPMVSVQQTRLLPETAYVS